MIKYVSKIYIELLKLRNKETTQLKYGQKILNTSSEKINKRKKVYKKDVKHHLSLEKCKLKQRHTTTHILEWLKSKNLTICIVSKDVEQ